MLTLSNLSVGYGQTTVINELSLEIADGMIHGLIGLNGSGKSTLLKCISGILNPASGKMMLENVQLKNTDVGFLETEPYFYHGITGREYLNLFKSHHDKNFMTDEWGRLFNIPLDDLIDGYSTGMKKKLAITGVIKTNRKILLLDEPFNGLDLESSRVLSTILPQLIQPGKIILVTSHILDTLKGVCSQIHYLNNGTIQRSFTPGDENEIEKVVFHDLDKQMAERIKRLV